METKEFTYDGIRVVQNGERVEIYGGTENRLHGYSHLNGRDIAALEVFINRKRDEEYDRWRSEVYPEVVVYKSDQFKANPAHGGVNIVDTTTGLSCVASREVKAHRLGFFEEVRKEFFVAHPVPTEPWHSAKEGETWLVKTEMHNALDFMLCEVKPGYGVRNTNGLAFVIQKPDLVAGLHLGTSAPTIKDARRVYPVDTDE